MPTAPYNLKYDNTYFTAPATVQITPIAIKNLCQNGSLDNTVTLKQIEFRWQTPWDTGKGLSQAPPNYYTTFF